MMTWPAPRRGSAPPPLAAAAWGIVRPELLYLSWAAMEVALLTPVALAWMPWAGAWPPLLVAGWLLLLVLLPLNLARWLTLLRVPLSRQRVLMAVAALAIMLAAVRALLYSPASPLDLGWMIRLGRHFAGGSNELWPRDLGVMGLVAFSWWRGGRLVSRRPDIQRLGRQVRVGGLLIAPLAILMTFRALRWSVAPFLLLFFVAALTAVALTRAEQVARAQPVRFASMTPRWVGIVIGTGLALTFAAGMLAFGLQRVTAAEMGWLAILWRPLRLGLSIVAVTLIYLLQPGLLLLEQLLIWLVDFWSAVFWRLLAAAPRAEDAGAYPGPGDLQAWLEQLQGPARAPLVNWRLVLLVLLVLMVVAAALWLGRVYQRPRPGVAGGDRTGGAVPSVDGRRPGRGWRRRLRRLRGWRAAASVRRIYRQMEQAAAAVGYGRGAAETPYEYLASLAKVWPGGKVETHQITEAYVRVRYGEAPETAAELAAIAAAWRRLEQRRPETTGA